MATAICIVAVWLQTTSLQGGPVRLTLNVALDVIVMTLAATAAVGFGLALAIPPGSSWPNHQRARRGGALVAIMALAATTALHCATLRGIDGSRDASMAHPLFPLLDVGIAILQWTCAFLIATAMVGWLARRGPGMPEEHDRPGVASHESKAAH